MLILLRHGQTTSNVDHKLDTRLPGAPLTELGQEQAREAGEEILELFDVSTVISSQAVRAQQTAEIAFGAQFPEIPAVEGIQEVHAGRWEMQNSYAAHEAYLRAFRGFYQRDLGATVEEGDSLEMFLARYKGALMPYVARDAEAAGATAAGAAGGTTVAVSHGGAIRAFTANACNVDPVYAEASYLPNCRYIVIDPGENPVDTFGDWRLISWADYELP